MKPRVAILISGRGSNMAALIEAAAAPNYPAEIALVVSNRVDAGGLGIAREAGIATSIFANRDFADRRAQEKAINEALQAHRVEIVLPCRLHAAAHPVSGRRLGGADAEHPPKPAAGLPRSRHACPRPCRGGAAAWFAPCIW